MKKGLTHGLVSLDARAYFPEPGCLSYTTFWTKPSNILSGYAEHPTGGTAELKIDLSKGFFEGLELESWTSSTAGPELTKED